MLLWVNSYCRHVQLLCIAVNRMKPQSFSLCYQLSNSLSTEDWSRPLFDRVLLGDTLFYFEFPICYLHFEIQQDWKYLYPFHHILYNSSVSIHSVWYTLLTWKTFETFALHDLYNACKSFTAIASVIQHLYTARTPFHFFSNMLQLVIRAFITFAVRKYSVKLISKGWRIKAHSNHSFFSIFFSHSVLSTNTNNFE